MQLPLFPLPNLVLFPNVLVPLHIFEERYKLMINECIDGNAPFGMVLLMTGADQENESTIYRVGVATRVVQVERLKDGRMNIVGQGESRFRIVRFISQHPYWTAEVEFFEDREESEISLRDVHAEVVQLYRRVFQLGMQLAGEPPSEPSLPETPCELSFVVTYTLDIPSEEKQRLLEMVSTRDRLTALVPHLQKTITALQEQIAFRQTVSKVRSNGDLGRPKGMA